MGCQRLNLLPLAALLLVACVSPGTPVVVDRSAAAVKDTYTVRRGDTLYSIAWRYGVDFRGLAAANRIARPYTIYPGQQILIAQAAPPAADQAPAPIKPLRAPQKTATRPPPGNVIPTSPKPSPKPAKQKPPPTQPKQAVAVVSGDWRWPVAGKVVRPFGRGNKGVDIEVQPPDRIRATRAGQVVYSGTGLGGYQSLVIVKHSPVYLSAYSFNVTPSLKEGEWVKEGGVVAHVKEPGRSTLVHFEIRKEGQPISPQTMM